MIVPGWRRDAMTYDSKAGDQRTSLCRSAALSHIDDAYNFASFLMRNQADAEAAVHECYLRVSRTLDGDSGQASKTRILAILRSVCHAKLARCGRHEAPTGPANDEQPAEAAMQLKTEVPSATTRPDRQDSPVMRRLIAALPTPLLEVIVLREYSAMPYREIAEVTHVSIEAVMSRLAQARAILLVAWKATNSAGAA